MALGRNESTPSGKRKTDQLHMTDRRKERTRGIHTQRMTLGPSQEMWVPGGIRNSKEVVRLLP